MNRLYRSFSQNISFSILFSFFSSLAVLPIMFIGKDEHINQLIKILFPIIFWMCTVFELVFIFTANSIRKEIEKFPENRKFRRSMGLVNFFSNKIAAKVDVTFMLSLLVFLIMNIFGLGENIVQYVVLFILILTFRVHCTLNGKNYRYKRYLKKQRERRKNEKLQKL